MLLKKEEEGHVEEAQLSQVHGQTLPRASPREQHHRSCVSVVHSQEGHWNVVSAAVVWQRMLCVLGDVNSIKNPVIHQLVMGGLFEVWKMLKEVGFHQAQGRLQISITVICVQYKLLM